MPPTTRRPRPARGSAAGCAAFEPAAPADHHDLGSRGSIVRAGPGSDRHHRARPETSTSTTPTTTGERSCETTTPPHPQPAARPSRRCGALGADEPEHISGDDLDRVALHDREERLQIEPGRQHRVRSTPPSSELKEIVHDLVTEPHPQPAIRRDRPNHRRRPRHQNFPSRPRRGDRPQSQTRHPASTEPTPDYPHILTSAERYGRRAHSISRLPRVAVAVEAVPLQLNSSPGKTFRCRTAGGHRASARYTDIDRDAAARPGWCDGDAFSLRPAPDFDRQYRGPGVVCGDFRLQDGHHPIDLVVRQSLA